MLSLTRQELDMNLPLVDSGDVSRSEVLRMQRQTSDLQGQINTRRSEYLAELQTEYAKTEEELASATEQLTQRSAILRGSELRSPTDGVIVAIKYNTVGGVLRAGDEVLQLVPTGDKLVVEARVSPSDIAFIRRGQTANVKFDAYDSSIYGSADGMVTHISADTLSEETKEGVQTYYRVLLSADPAKLRPRHEGEKIVLQPGMTATAEIITGQTTVFRYLTKPILKTTAICSASADRAEKRARRIGPECHGFSRAAPITARSGSRTCWTLGGRRHGEADFLPLGRPAASSPDCSKSRSLRAECPSSCRACRCGSRHAPPAGHRSPALTVPRSSRPARRARHRARHGGRIVLAVQEALALADRQRCTTPLAERRPDSCTWRSAPLPRACPAPMVADCRQQRCCHDPYPLHVHACTPATQALCYD